MNDSWGPNIFYFLIQIWSQETHLNVLICLYGGFFPLYFSRGVTSHDSLVKTSGIPFSDVMRVIQNDQEKDKNKLELREAAQNTQNGFSRKRKGKNSKFPKLSENDMIAKSALQYF